MQIFGINVALMRKRTGLTRAELAKRVGVGETTIKSIETGYIAAPPQDLAEKLAGVFGTTADGLLGKTYLDVGERSRAIYIADSISFDKPYLEVDKIVDTVFVDRDEVRDYDYIGIRIKDNLMNDARLFKGDTVLVCQNAIIKNGDIVVAVFDNTDSIVRRYYFEDGKTVLSGDKSKGCPDIVFEKGEKQPIIIGKVTKCLFNL